MIPVIVKAIITIAVMIFFHEVGHGLGLIFCGARKDTIKFRFIPKFGVLYKKKLTYGEENQMLMLGIIFGIFPLFWINSCWLKMIILSLYFLGCRGDFKKIRLGG